MISSWFQSMEKGLQIVFIAVAVPDHPIYIHFSEKAGEKKD
ncbi:MAG: hypothetical protein ACLFNW_07065 [Desulfobacterales bacterium]